MSGQGVAFCSRREHTTFQLAHSTADCACRQTWRPGFARSGAPGSFGLAGRCSSGSADWLGLKRVAVSVVSVSVSVSSRCRRRPGLWGAESGESRGEPGNARAVVSPRVPSPPAAGRAAAEPAGGRSRRRPPPPAWRLDWHPRWSPPRLLSRPPRPPLGGAPGPRSLEWQPRGPTDLASECAPGCRSSAENPDSSLGVRRESGLRTQPGFAGVAGLQGVARQPAAIGVLAPDRGEVRAGPAHLSRLGIPAHNCVASRPICRAFECVAVRARSQQVWGFCLSFFCCCCSGCRG